MLKIQLREYQKNILKTALFNNTLVILPTGLGKTVIAFALMERYKPALFLAPTKPLVEQHVQSFLKLTTFSLQDVGIATGSVRKREMVYSKLFVFATPQTVVNDMLSLTKNKFNLVVFDEAHRAVGEYAYTKIAKYFEPKRILALTASPGANREKIYEIIKNLRIEEIEYRSEQDPDVLPYVAEKRLKYVFVRPSKKLLLLIKCIEDVEKTFAKKLESFGIVAPKSKAEIPAVTKLVETLPVPDKFEAMTFYSAYLMAFHLREIVETQSFKAAKDYLSKIRAEKGGLRSYSCLQTHPSFIRFLSLLEGEEHPKIEAFLDLMTKLSGKKGIVFAQYRNQVFYLAELLRQRGMSAEPFVGKKEGYSQKKQKEIMEAFRKDKFNILVASSIGEEGIDVPAVDYVIFYEPIPSEIRTIQRRGRAARTKEGEIYILITKRTRDERFLWAAKTKERKMKKIIASLRSILRKNNSQQRIWRFIDV